MRDDTRSHFKNSLESERAGVMILLQERCISNTLQQFIGYVAKKYVNDSMAVGLANDKFDVQVMTVVSCRW